MSEMPDNANDAWIAWMKSKWPGATPKVQSLLWDLWCRAWTGGRIQARMQFESEKAEPAPEPAP